MREPPFSTFPLGCFFSLDVKSSSDSVLFNVNIDGPPLHRYDVVGSASPGGPVVVKLRIDMMMLVMKRIPQQEVVSLVYLFLQQNPNGSLSHDIIEHFPEVLLIIVSGISRVNPGQVEGLP